MSAFYDIIGVSMKGDIQVQIVIDIPKERYDEIHSLKFVMYGLQSEENRKLFYRLINAVQDGTVLTECEDTISREDAIKLVECSGYDLQFRTDNADMCNDVRKLPSVTPSKPKGHWIKCKNDYECSECGGRSEWYYDYCHDCGVEMNKPQKREDKE